MRIPPIVPALFLAVVAPCQQGGNLATNPVTPKPTPAAAPRSSPPVLQFDPSTGWPIGVDDAPIPAAPKGETAPRKDKPTTSARTDAPAAAAPMAEAPNLASGTQLGSPLLDVFQATGGPGEWKKLGGVIAHWRIVVNGPNGEEIGAREVVHTADVLHADRDRLDHADGRVHGRFGGQVYAERNGMPMPASTEPAALELALFGAQLRMPWLFGDANAYAVVGKSIEERNGERLRKVTVERRPPAHLDTVGPQAAPKPADRFELLFDPASGVVRELVHRFAETQQTRRVLLEDWREFNGMRLPCRRVYVDEALRPTTVLELTRIERRRVTDRDFRQL
ncbi:MAG: hypothetical protein FJ301_10340 [Planctomycetes bacterium]|nr:hypothetical protein [Planctomycetota bacterium]